MSTNDSSHFHEKEKRKNKAKHRPQRLLPVFALGWLLFSVMFFLSTVGDFTPRVPTPTWTPPAQLVTALNAPADAPFSAVSLSAWGDGVGEVQWEGETLRWRSLRALPDGDWLVVSGGSARLEAPLAHALLSPDGQWLLMITHRDGLYRTQLMRTDGKLSHVQPNAPFGALSPDGRQAVIGQASGAITYYALDSSALVSAQLPPRSSDLRLLALGSSGLVALDGGAAVRYQRLLNPTTASAPLIGQTPTYAAVLLSTGEAAVLSADAVTIYDFQGGYRRYELERPALARSDALVVSADGQQLAVLHADGLTLIHQNSGRPLLPEVNRPALSFWPMKAPQAAVFSPNPDELLISSGGGLRVVRAGQVARTLAEDWPEAPIESIGR